MTNLVAAILLPGAGVVNTLSAWRAFRKDEGRARLEKEYLASNPVQIQRRVEHLLRRLSCLAQQERLPLREVG